MIRALRRNKDPMAAPPYLSRYKLRESPFASGARFFYADPERAQTLNMLQHLTQYSEELLLVSGPVGSGKSTLLEQYLTRADEDWKVCRVSALETPDPAALFLAAARCFGLHTDGMAADALLDALREHLNQLQQTMTPVLVVDDADRLSDDALEIVVRLAELPGEHGKLVRTILFADGAILPRFGSERFASAPRPHNLDIKPLDEAQTLAYLQHRLASAGFAGGPLFQPRDLKRIHRQSQGWPGAINQLAHEVLLSKRKTAGAVPWPYLAAGLLVAGGAAAYFHLSGGSVMPAKDAMTVTAGAPPAPERPIVRYAEPAQPVPTALVVRGGETIQITCAAPPLAEAAVPVVPMLREVTPPPALAEPAPPVETAAAPAAVAPEPATQEAAAQEAAAQEAAAQEAAAQEPMPVAVAPEPVPEPAAPEPAVPATAAPEPATPMEETPAVPAPQDVPGPAAAPVAVIERVEPDPVPGSRQPQTLTLHGRHFTADSQVTVSWRGRRKTLAGAQVQVLDGERIAIEITTGTTPDTWSVAVAGADGQLSDPFRFQVTAPAKATAPAPAPAAPPPAVAQPAAAGFHDAAWLWSQDPRHYTVQLVAASTEQAVRDHLQGYDVSGAIALLVTRRDGKPWHVVFWGDFADRAAAERAVAGLPAALKRVSPWIRPFADVHGEMTAAGEGRPDR